MQWQFLYHTTFQCSKDFFIIEMSHPTLEGSKDVYKNRDKLSK